MLKTIGLAVASAAVVATMAVGSAQATPNAELKAKVVKAKIVKGPASLRMIGSPKCTVKLRVRPVSYSRMKLMMKGYRHIKYLGYTPLHKKIYRTFPPKIVCIAGTYTFKAQKGRFIYRIKTQAYKGYIVSKKIIGIVPALTAKARMIKKIAKAH